MTDNSKSRSSDCQSLSSYYSCSSNSGDDDHNAVLSDICLHQPLKKRSLSCSIDQYLTSTNKLTKEPKEKNYTIVKGCSVNMIRGEETGDSLVAVYGEEAPLTVMVDGTKSFSKMIEQPIYVITKEVNWKYAARVLLKDVTSYGVYLVGLIWKLKRPFQLTANEKLFSVNKPVILHCICKEPVIRFNGRIGPISTFVPHTIQNNNKRISGIWVSFFSDQIYAEFIYQLEPFKSDYRARLKEADKTFDQVMFFVSNEAACVGIQVMNTKGEEKQIRQSKQIYHHERPLILQDGFYLVEGTFEITFLNSNQTTANLINSKKLNINFSSGPKIVIIAEGTHLIRTVTEPVFHRSSSIKKIDNKTIMKTRIDENNNQGNKSPSRIETKGKENTNIPTNFRISSKSKWRHLPPFNSNVVEDSIQIDKPEHSQQVTKIRKVEVCLDCRYDRIIVLDHSVLKQDFFNFQLFI